MHTCTTVIIKSDLSNCTYYSIGINRNDVYITLERGEYDKGTKTAQKNVEVAVVVVNDSGEIRQVKYILITYF